MRKRASALRQRVVKGSERKEQLHFERLSEDEIQAAIEHDEESLMQGRLVAGALSHGLYSFVPDDLFEQLVQNYSLTRQLLGSRLIREISGYDEDYLEKNLRIPEFRRELRQAIGSRMKSLREHGILDKSHRITEKGVEMAAIVLLLEELDRLAKGYGEKSEQPAVYGDRDTIRNYVRGDRYRDISLRKTIKAAVIRQHSSLQPEDLRVFTRKAKGQVDIIFALDASGSMRGSKVESCKRAGIALAHRATMEKDRVGLIVFGKDVRKTIAPTHNLTLLLKEMVSIRAGSETNISKSLRESMALFTHGQRARHLVLITDAMPTSGKRPKEDTIRAAEDARAEGITISVVGIKLSNEGSQMAERIAEIGRGKLYAVDDIDTLDRVVLRDYYALE